MPWFAGFGDSAFVRAFSATIDPLGLDEIVEGRRRILVATGEVLEPKMPGPTIRAWKMACTLAREHDVQLVSDQDCRLSHPDFGTRAVDESGLAELEAWADVIVFQGYVMRQHPVLRKSRKIIVVDIYDPFHLEVLEQARHLEPAKRMFAVLSSADVLNEQLRRGDFFLCASEKQRDFWLGQLAAVGRINSSTYGQSENLDSLIAVAPLGLDEEPARHTRPVLRGVVPGIGSNDKIVLWGGGVYNWLDPLTLLRAVDKLRRRLPEVRLYFLGLQHPSLRVGEMQMTTDAVDLARDLRLLGTHVFFNEDWVAHDDRQNYLLEADVGVSTHLDHIESEFSFRTRVLDYLWTSLPIVATAGDSLAALIESEKVGITVPPGDVLALEDALFRLLDDTDLHASCRAAIARVAPSFRWSNVLRPLVGFCRSPARAPDLVDPEMAALVGNRVGGMWLQTGWKADARKAIGFVRRGEMRLLLSRVKARLTRR
jgi:glycosyltransferase involved in cell wall biosynthesis